MQVSKKGFKRRSLQEELLPPQGKELGNLQLNQCTARLQEVEGKGLMWHLVLVEVLQLEKEKPQSALIAIDGIWVFTDY